MQIQSQDTWSLQGHQKGFIIVKRALKLQEVILSLPHTTSLGVTVPKWFVPLCNERPRFYLWSSRMWKSALAVSALLSYGLGWLLVGCYHSSHFWFLFELFTKLQLFLTCLCSALYFYCVELQFCFRSEVNWCWQINYQIDTLASLVYDVSCHNPFLYP